MNQIIWERWKDPLRAIVARAKKNKPYEQDEDDDDAALARARASFDDGTEGDGENPYDDGQSRGFSGPCVMGSFGVVPMFESNVPSKLFNFWMGHTDFRLTKKMARVITAVPGIESLDIFSPYRFRIAVGRAFKQEEVMRAVDAAVQPPAPPPAPALPAQPKGTDPYRRLRAILAKKYPFWAIAVTGTGEQHGVGGATADEVLEKLKRYEGAQHVTSWEGR